TVGDNPTHGLKIRVETPAVEHRQEAASFFGDAKQLDGFQQSRGDGLVHHDVASGLQALHRKGEMRLVGRGNHHQPDGIDGQEFLDAAHNARAGITLGGFVAAALQHGGKPQPGDGVDQRRVKVPPCQAKPNESHVDHAPRSRKTRNRQQCITDAPAAAGEIALPPFVPAAATLYPLRVEKSPPQRGPTLGLYLGLIVTILAVLAYAGYITRQFAGLRKLQGEMVDRNRKDSLQLLRIQNDLNSLGLAMRDMLDASEPYPLIAWTAQFDRTHNDLSAALKQEETLAEATRTSDQRLYLTQSLTQFWDACDRMFSQAQNGQEKPAREQIRDTLQPQQAALSSAVSRLLVQNNEGEEQAAARIAEIYDRVQRQLYFFLAAILLAIVVTSLYLIRYNRRIFAHVA